MYRSPKVRAVISLDVSFSRNVHYSFISAPSFDDSCKPVATLSPSYLICAIRAQDLPLETMKPNETQDITAVANDVIFREG